jgi:hypothetical protein
MFPDKMGVNLHRADLVAEIALHAGPYTAVDAGIETSLEDWKPD